MNTNTAISAVNKLLEYVKEKELDSKSKTMYHKSKIHLSELSKSCTQIVDIIAGILEDSAYGTDASDIEKDVNCIAARVNKLQKFVMPSNGVQHITSIFSADSQLSDPTYCDCFNLLKDWYNCRFVLASQINPRYTYKSEWVLQWVENIVIGYGKYFHNNAMSDYYNMFNLWKSKVLNEKNPSMYSIPYEVYRYDITLSEEDCTVESLILWNMLCTHNLSQLIDTPLSMYNRFARLSDVVDEYDRIGGDINVFYANT